MSAVAARTIADLGVIRVAFDTKPVRSDLTQDGRKLAAGEAHTLVGSAQNVTKRGQTWTADYAPLRKVAPAAPAAPESPATGDDRLAFLERELARVTALLAATQAAPAAPVPTAPVSEATAKVQARIAASAKLACKVCRDYGVVRLTPRENGRVNFRSAEGAKAATANGHARPCECQARRTA